MRAEVAPGRDKVVASLTEAIQKCGLQDGMTVSFHHHLRDGDYVVNMVMEAIASLAGQYPGRLLFSPGDTPAFTLKLRRTDDPLRTAAQAVERYGALLNLEKAP